MSETSEELAARQLRSLRKGRGWPQQEVADRMKAFGYNWRQSTIGKIEAARRPIRLNELADFAVLYGIQVADLLIDAPERPCPRCAGNPPEGFICNTCGRGA